MQKIKANKSLTRRHIVSRHVPVATDNNRLILYWLLSIWVAVSKKSKGRGGVCVCIALDRPYHVCKKYFNFRHFLSEENKL